MQLLLADIYILRGIVSVSGKRESALAQLSYKSSWRPVDEIKKKKHGSGRERSNREKRSAILHSMKKPPQHRHTQNDHLLNARSLFFIPLLGDRVFLAFHAASFFTPMRLHSILLLLPPSLSFVSLSLRVLASSLHASALKDNNNTRCWWSLHCTETLKPPNGEKRRYRVI